MRRCLIFLDKCVCPTFPSCDYDRAVPQVFRLHLIGVHGRPVLILVIQEQVFDNNVGGQQSRLVQFMCHSVSSLSWLKTT